MRVTVFHFTLLASVVSLAVAWIAQYGFGLMPCELCLMQRVPYGLVVILSLLGMARPNFCAWLIPAIVVAFLAGSGIAVYHAAVEKHVLKGPSACTSAPASAGESFDDFRKRIEDAPVVACDQPAWEFHGITMAGVNALWSFVLAMAVACIQRKKYAKVAG
jgi:disulfide bond formation protein DsbB